MSSFINFKYISRDHARILENYKKAKSVKKKLKRVCGSIGNIIMQLQLFVVNTVYSRFPLWRSPYVLRGRCRWWMIPGKPVLARFTRLSTRRPILASLLALAFRVIVEGQFLDDARTFNTGSLKTKKKNNKK